MSDSQAEQAPWPFRHILDLAEDVVTDYGLGKAHCDDLANCGCSMARLSRAVEGFKAWETVETRTAGDYVFRPGAWKP